MINLEFATQKLTPHQQIAVTELISQLRSNDCYHAHQYIWVEV